MVKIPKFQLSLWISNNVYNEKLKYQELQRVGMKINYVNSWWKLIIHDFGALWLCEFLNHLHNVLDEEEKSKKGEKKNWKNFF